MAFADSGSAGQVCDAAMRCPVTLHGTVSVGDPLGYDGTGWVRANATVAIVIPAELYALEDGVSGDTINASPLAAIAGRISGASPGNLVYLGRTTAGRYTETKPSTTGDITNPIGYSIAADMIIVGMRGAAQTVAP